MQLVESLLNAVKKFLVGVVELTRKVILTFVATVMAGLGMAVILAAFVSLVAALALSGIRMKEEPADIQADGTIIDITPAVA
ncbi:MAG: hypothetical protein ACKO85_09505 [Isosphaeraceae bacterium]